jgi:predicted NodU family carbamoyl transferase
MRVLGISAYYHDSAAALVSDGDVVAAAHEERFSRKKFDESFPHQAIHYCLETAGARLRDIDNVVFYDKPFLKFERLLETYLAFAPRGFASFVKAMPLWLSEKLFQKSMLLGELRKIDPDFDAARLMFTEHHHAHAASAFFPSPFEEALVLTVDGVGEWSTTTAGLGRGNRVDILKEIHFPHSLGLFYSAFTSYIGFRVNSGEYKLMGLAPYGEPRYRDVIRDNLIDLKPDGSFRLDMSYFNYCTGLTMTNTKFDRLFGMPPRDEREPLTQIHMDIAASAQVVLEEAMLLLTRGLAAEYPQRNLCLAGGVALNCVANGKILRDGKFDQIWVQPAAGDAGGALGNRSILADPRNREMQRTLNLKVKYRESFRPFAPAVLAEDVSDWFELDRPSPYMLLVADVGQRRRVEPNGADHLDGLDKLKVIRSEIPAVTHVDYSARVQTVHLETNPRFHALLSAFKAKTGCPVLVNTSFNVRGEPIACSPEDAFRCLMGTEIEMLVVGNCILYKDRQNPALIRDYRNAFDPD